MALKGPNQPPRYPAGQPGQTYQQGTPARPPQGIPPRPAPSANGGKAERSQRDSVLFGDTLRQEAPILNTPNPVLYFKGKDNQGRHHNIPISASLLSRHFMLLGGIGTGKTNTFFQILSQLNRTMTKDDVMIIFDTKGDFYKEFYQPGDVVISNDETAVGPDGKPDYWNIFNEVATGVCQRDGNCQEPVPGSL